MALKHEIYMVISRVCSQNDNCFYETSLSILTIFFFFFFFILNQFYKFFFNEQTYQKQFSDSGTGMVVRNAQDLGKDNEKLRVMLPDLEFIFFFVIKSFCFRSMVLSIKLFFFFRTD